MNKKECDSYRGFDSTVVGTVKTSKMLGSVSEGAVDEECVAEAK